MREIPNCRKCDFLQGIRLFNWFFEIRKHKVENLEKTLFFKHFWAKLGQYEIRAGTKKFSKKLGIFSFFAARRSTKGFRDIQVQSFKISKIHSS
jgi:hypothetical protein